MSVRLPTYAAISLVLVFLTSPACSPNSITPTSPNTTTNLKSLSAEPEMVRPEFVSNPSCLTHQAFGVRLIVIIGGEDLIVRGIRFGFTDRFGNRSLPDVFSTTAGSTSIPSSGPVPFPGAAVLPNVSAIPIPGSSPITGMLVPDAQRLSLPFFLRFGCDVFPEGTIVITLDTADTVGRPGTREVNVAVRQ